MIAGPFAPAPIILAVAARGGAALHAAGRAAARMRPPHPHAAAHGLAWFDLVVFLLTYLGIAAGGIPGLKTDRTGIAMLGAIVILAAGRLRFAVAMGYIGFSTLALLFGLMFISAQLDIAGFYRWVIRRLVRIAHKPWVLLTGIVAVAAFLSALFANDIICLVFTPVLCVAMRRSKCDPIPFLIALVTASNIGSAATLIGNPQNMLIGQTAHLSFGHYTLIALPLVIICLALDVLLVAAVYRKRIFAPAGEASGPEKQRIGSNVAGPGTAANRAEGLADDRARPGVDAVFGPTHGPWAANQATGKDDEIDWPVIIKTLVTMALLLVAFFIGRAAGIHRDVAALAAAGILLLSRKHEPDTFIHHINWKLILLFIGLFIVVGDIRYHGILRMTLDGLRHFGVHLKQPWPLAAATVGLSNIASNVPAVLLLKAGIHGRGAASQTNWFILAIVSTFAGNLCLLGSIANILVAEQARRNDVRMRFLEFSKVGLPLALITSALAVCYLTLLR